ncbi:tyrosine-type recombinase/integrase [Nocardia farcinica]|uniref:tyrosine-type recombinase/integrase n=1 Tax=Nocardia farcinica TaxID=37329 RepID=UPI001892FA0A|nr:site-specific integrase [Nocardia farcinica]MBF6072572.1 site-specific integrase [Nocardia farcinica]
MTPEIDIPVGVRLSSNIEHRADYGRRPFKARVRWTEPGTKKRSSVSEPFETREEAEAWIARLERKAAQGIDPKTATMRLADYGDANMDLALRGVEGKTLDPYMAGWRKRVVPTIGHLPVAMLTNGAIDRAVVAWINDGASKSTVKNTLAVLVRVMEQAVRDGIRETNPARVRGWQQLYQQIEDELDDPRSLALPDWSALVTLADALVNRSADRYPGWGDVVIFAACTASRIGEVSGCRVADIDTDTWTWTVRRQTTPSPGGMADKGTKGNRACHVPLIEEVRQLVLDRLNAAGRNNPDARLFVGPRGGRIATGVLRDATHWDEVVSKLGYEHLRRHDLRHTGLTWMADAGVSLHVLQKIAGHADSRTTERYLHPDRREITGAGDKLSKHLRSRSGPALRVAGE